MKFLILAQFITLFSLAFALKWPGKRDDNTVTTLSAKPTTVWVTITTNGVVITTSSLWTQSFMTTFTNTVSGVLTGAVGLGTLSGSVGDIRSYSQTTVNEGRTLVYSGMFGLFALVVGLLI